MYEIKKQYAEREKQCTFTMDRPEMFSYRYPFEGALHITIEVVGPAHSIRSCITSQILHQLKDKNIIDQKALIKSIFVERRFSPIKKTLVTIVSLEA